MTENTIEGRTDNLVEGTPLGASIRTPVETGWHHAQAYGFKGLRGLLRGIPMVDRLWLCAKVVRDTRSLLSDFWYDFVRVWRYTSAVWSGNTKEKLSALIVMAYHGLEKGLSLPNPRPGFGQELAALLLSRLDRYLRYWKHDEVSKSALGALEAYLKGASLDQREEARFRAAVERLRAKGSCNNRCGNGARGGVITIRYEDFIGDAKRDLTSFFSSRHSVRHFAQRDVDINEIKEAVRLAQATPSACNRQAARVWVVSDRAAVKKILTVQEGAEGFKDQVPLILIVSASLSCFQSSGERYQAWIDGALFAMTLVWALHSRGLATCMLNWSKSKNKDRELRRILPLPGEENIVVMIAVGHPPGEWKVPVSARVPLEKVMRIVPAVPPKGKE